MNIGDRVTENNTTSDRVAELRQQARLTSSWDGLRAVLKEAQAAVDAGEVRREEGGVPGLQDKVVVALERVLPVMYSMVVMVLQDL